MSVKSKPLNPPVFLMDNIKLDGKLTKVKWKILACITSYLKFWGSFIFCIVYTLSNCEWIVMKNNIWKVKHSVKWKLKKLSREFVGVFKCFAIVPDWTVSVARVCSIIKKIIFVNFSIMLFKWEIINGVNHIVILTSSPNEDTDQSLKKLSLFKIF